MSVINGIWHKDGRPVGEGQLLQQVSLNEKYAPDGTTVHRAGPIGMSFQGFHTHERSSFASGPFVDGFGNSAVLDGRIDNSEQLSEELGMRYQDTGDTALVLAAFRKWKEGCFDHIVGDWAVAIWHSSERALYLARDHAGTRTLYYAEVKNVIGWSTYPESLIALQPDYKFCDDYAVRYLACLPLDDLTPYEHIRTVHPGHYVRFSEGLPVQKRRYWHPELRVRSDNRSEESYQEEFLQLFRQSVKRRVDRSNNLICHLSGGMDSSAIVCIADLLAKEGEIPEQVRTLSFYDTTEPNWDDHLYFSVVESQRGKVGTHIPGSSSSRSFESTSHFYPLPGADSASWDRELALENALGPGTVRVIVAGHGGDELLGGHPDPIPELADYLYRFQWRTFASCAFDWARAARRPILAITRDSIRFLWSLYPRPKRVSRQLPPWMQELPIDSIKSEMLRLWQSHNFDCIPSQLDKEDTWENICDTLPHLFHAGTVRYEYRYPFLDRDLVEFLLSVPPIQLRRPKRRRYMMRRALREIVPEQIIERRRKAYMSRGHMSVVQANSARMAQLISLGRLTSRALIDRKRFLQVLELIARGEACAQWLVPLMRAIELELWINQAISPDRKIQLGNQDLHALSSNGLCRNSQRGVL